MAAAEPAGAPPPPASLQPLTAAPEPRQQQQQLKRPLPTGQHSGVDLKRLRAVQLFPQPSLSRRGAGGSGALPSLPSTPGRPSPGPGPLQQLQWPRHQLAVGFTVLPSRSAAAKRAAPPHAGAAQLGSTQAAQLLLDIFAQRDAQQQSPDAAACPPPAAQPERESPPPPHPPVPQPTPRPQPCDLPPRPCLPPRPRASQPQRSLNELLHQPAAPRLHSPPVTWKQLLQELGPECERADSGGASSTLSLASQPSSGGQQPVQSPEPPPHVLEQRGGSPLPTVQRECQQQERPPLERHPAQAPPAAAICGRCMPPQRSPPAQLPAAAAARRQAAAMGPPPPRPPASLAAHAPQLRCPQQRQRPTLGSVLAAMQAELADITSMQQLMALLPLLPALDLQPAEQAAPAPLPQPPPPPPPLPVAVWSPPPQPAVPAHAQQPKDSNAALLAALQQVMELQPGQRELLVGLLPLLER